MKYELRQVSPSTGKPRPGTINSLTGEYQSNRNAIRFMCQRLENYDHFPAGQYKLDTWPCYVCSHDHHVAYLYKRATTSVE